MLVAGAKPPKQPVYEIVLPGTRGYGGRSLHASTVPLIACVARTCVRARVCVCACVCARARVCVCVCACVCVCVFLSV